MATTIKNKKLARGRTADGAPNPIDIHVGNRLRIRRNMLGISQEKLADMLGLTFQQVQKYERGTNRIGASRLWDIASVLNVSVTFFYEDMSMDIKQASPRYQVAENTVDFKGKLIIFDEAIGLSDPMAQSETLELITNYYKINNRILASHLFDTIKAAAKYTGSKENINNE